MADIITKNNYIKYDVSEVFEVYKARDVILLNNTVIDNTTGEQNKNNIDIHLNDYGRTVNAINYAAIKYLTVKYDFIRATFVNIRGNWATKLVDATNNTDKHKRGPVLIVDKFSYQFFNMPQGPIDYDTDDDFMNAIGDLIMRFNGKTSVADTPTSKIIMNELWVEFNVKCINGKKYYYIDNLFMLDENSKYSWNTIHLDYKQTAQQANNIDLSKYRDTTYDTVFTMLTQVPGVLDANGNICKSIADKALYKQNKLEQYITDANIATGYKLFSE